MTDILNRKSILARLLSKENIRVTTGNFPTAWFDTKNRILGLPLWKQMSTDLYDLMVGHEVGHALYTPENWHVDGIPPDYLNIVEDIRIEKKILNEYPGLIGGFSRGYTEMMFDRDLFGIKGKNLAELGFLDRLNIKAKGRALVEVPFAKDEKPLVDMAMAVETYDDVIAVCRELVKFMKQKLQERKQGQGSNSKQEPQKKDGQKSEKAKRAPAEEKSTEETEDGDASGKPAEKSEEKPKRELDDAADDSKPDGEKGEEAEGDASGEGEENSPQEPENGDGSAEDGEIEALAPEAEPDSLGKGTTGNLSERDLEKVETENQFQKNQSQLVEKTDDKVILQPFDANLVPVIVTSNSELIAAREVRENHSRAFGYTFPAEKFAEFKKKRARVVSNLAKEFEMRKAAFRLARARTSTKGALDTNKLHSYKFNDHLFKQVTTLADGKNHGMIMLVDYSGSMSDSIADVLRQTLILTEFCKRVGIPFDVYGFTTNTSVKHNRIDAADKGKFARVNFNGVGIFHLIGSALNKVQYEKSERGMFAQSDHRAAPKAIDESMGSTPLNAALLVMEPIVKAFMSKYQTEKMIFVTLTDGDSDSLRAKSGVDMLTGYNRHKKVLSVFGKPFEVSGGPTETAAILDAYRDRGIKTVNFFIESKYGLQGKLHMAGKDRDQTKEAIQFAAENGAFVLDDSLGYSRRFFVLRSTMSADDGLDYDFGEEASAAKIAKVFAKATNNRDKSRLLVKKFSEIIA